MSGIRVVIAMDGSEHADYALECKYNVGTGLSAETVYNFCYYSMAKMHFISHVLSLNIWTIHE